MDPRDTMNIDPSRKPTRINFRRAARCFTSADPSSALVDFEVWDLPGGQTDLEAARLAASTVASVIYVIDAQAQTTSLTEVTHKLGLAIARIHLLNPRTTFDIFVHKIDGMSLDLRSDLLEDMRQRVVDVLADLPDSGELDGLPGWDRATVVLPTPAVQPTSVYDHSILEALSKVVRKLMPCQGPLETLLDSLINNSLMEKAMLFHLPTKLYVGSDVGPVDAQSYESCSHYIDLSLDFFGLYGCAIRFEVTLTSQARLESANATGRHVVQTTDAQRIPRHLARTVIVGQLGVDAGAVGEAGGPHSFVGSRPPDATQRAGARSGALGDRSVRPHPPHDADAAETSASSRCSGRARSTSTLRCSSTTSIAFVTSFSRSATPRASSSHHPPDTCHRLRVYKIVADFEDSTRRTTEQTFRAQSVTGHEGSRSGARGIGRRTKRRGSEVTATVRRSRGQQRRSR